MSNFMLVLRLHTVLLAVLLLSACGPRTFTRSTMVYEPYVANELQQTKDGITVELKHVEEFPPTFTASVQACDQYHQPLFSDGNPVMESVSFADNSTQYWEQLAITNNTANVIRMNGVVIRLFDPAANQYEVLAHDEVMSLLYAGRPCSTTSRVEHQFRVNKVFSRNMEIVPGTTSTFWIPFLPASKYMEGLWKFAIYDVPVRVDAAGTPLRKTQFDMRVQATKITSTYSQTNPFAQPQLIHTSDAPVQPVTSQIESSLPPASPVIYTSREMIAGAQAKLNELGYDAGPVDGIAGNRTRQAISDFQNDNALTVTGELDGPTASALGL